MDVEFRWPSSPPEPIAMIRNKQSGSLMPSHTYRENADDRAIVPIAC